MVGMSVHPPRRIALVGLMAAGKSRVGRLLAASLSCPFVDADQLAEERAGRPISDIFREEGEPRFRALEAEILTELAGREPPLVVATGGGVVESEANRTRLRGEFVTVWIELDPGEAARRVGGSRGKRPLLSVSDPEGVLRELSARRAPWYRQVSRHRVHSTRDTRPEDLRDVILDLLEGGGVDEGGGG